MVQIGGMGLIKAVEKFDVKMGYTFLTYAQHWIIQHIKRHIIDEGSVIRIPVHMFESVSKLISLKRDYEICGIEATTEEICTKLNIKKKKYDEINRVIEAIMNPRYLDALIGDSDNTEVIDLVVNDKEDLRCSEVEREAIQNSQSNEIQKLLFGLSPKEREVIILRFGLSNEGLKKTLDEIGQQYGVSRERIRQVENRALSKMKKLNRSYKSNLEMDIISMPRNNDIQVKVETIYSFKDLHGNSKIPERSEIFKKIIELYPEEADVSELANIYVLCASQNGYSKFNSKEKERIKQSFIDYLKKKDNKISIKELTKLIVDLDPNLLNNCNEFYEVFNDFALSSGYTENNLPSNYEIENEMLNYKEEHSKEQVPSISMV